MKIIHIITSLRTGGSEKLMVDLLPLLKEAGHAVELVVIDGTRTPLLSRLEQKKIPIRILQFGGNVYNPNNIRVVRQYLKGADIVHTHNTASQFLGALLKFIHPDDFHYLITTEHNTRNRRRKIPFFKPIDCWMYNRYNKIICISKQAEVNLRSYLRIEDDRICTIYNGIPINNYLPTKEFAFQISRRNNRSIIITMVAAFRKQKDHATLIKALTLLPENYQAQFVGGGNESLKNKCISLVAQCGLNERVHFLGVRTDISDVIQNSDILVLSSHYEGLSLFSLEAMASCKPFVASDVDGLHEIVYNAGILFPHENYLLLSTELFKLVENNEYYISIANQCMQRAKQFDIKIMAIKYSELYRNFFKYEST